MTVKDDWLTNNRWEKEGQVRLALNAKDRALEREKRIGVALLRLGLAFEPGSRRFLMHPVLNIQIAFRTKGSLADS